MGKGSAPAAPDYTSAAQATAASNNHQLAIQTAANRPTINTPWGSSSWNAVAGVDPATGESINNWTNSINLSPEQQAALTSQQQIAAGRSGAALGLLNQAGNAFQTPIDYGATTHLFDYGGPAQMNISGGPASAGLSTNPFSYSAAGVSSGWQGGDTGYNLQNYQGNQGTTPHDNLTGQPQSPTGGGPNGTTPASGAPANVGTTQGGGANTFGSGGAFGNANGNPYSTNNPGPTNNSGVAGTILDPNFMAGTQAAPRAEPGFATERPMQQYDMQAPMQRAQAFGYGGQQQQSSPTNGMDFFSQQATEAIRGRQNPQLDRQRAQLDQQLANQGITMGSEAWRNAHDDLGRQQNDADLAAITAGINQGNTAFGQGMQLGQFANNARQQEFSNANQNYLQGNQARQMQQQGNTAFGQYRQSLQAQQLQQMAAARGMPLNELNALLSGTQVSQPNFGGPSSTAGMGQGVNYTGAAQNQYQAGLDQFSIGQAQNQGMMNGLGSLASMASMFSDERLKTDISPVGKLNDGTPLFSWKWKDSGEPDVGVIAQEVERHDPAAVKMHPSGYKMVDYARIIRKQARVH